MSSQPKLSKPGIHYHGRTSADSCRRAQQPYRLQGMMRRRFSALLTCILVLTFSLSGWSSVCESMSDKSTSHATAHTMPTDAEPDMSGPLHSGHSPGKGVPVGHCRSAASCPGVSLGVGEADTSIDARHSDPFRPFVELAPASQSLDLEPPPPKA